MLEMEQPSSQNCLEHCWVQSPLMASVASAKAPKEWLQLKVPKRRPQPSMALVALLTGSHVVLGPWRMAVQFLFDPHQAVSQPAGPRVLRFVAASQPTHPQLPPVAMLLSALAVPVELASAVLVVLASEPELPVVQASVPVVQASAPLLLPKALAVCLHKDRRVQLKQRQVHPVHLFQSPAPFPPPLLLPHHIPLNSQHQQCLLAAVLPWKAIPPGLTCPCCCLFIVMARATFAQTTSYDAAPGSS
jgi:hypothetical protein